MKAGTVFWRCERHVPRIVEGRHDEDEDVSSNERNGSRSPVDD